MKLQRNPQTDKDTTAALEKIWYIKNDSTDVFGHLMKTLLKVWKIWIFVSNKRFSPATPISYTAGTLANYTFTQKN